MDSPRMFVRGFLCGLLVLGPCLARADLLGDLSASDRAKVKAGEQVMTSETLDGYPWPRVRVYQKVNATPREVVAVFFDYNNACHYIPNCLTSRISKELSPRSFEVDYVIDVPILPDEAYTVRNELKEDGDDKLCVDWTVLRATSIVESRGNLAVEPFGDGSVIRYTNLVKPSSKAAFLLKGMAMSQMKDTVQAIVSQVQKQKGNPSALRADVSRLDSALRGAN
ncbi:MAG TPA: hypothetical protein VIM61_04655 [Chthoniobacterales bacterium]